MGVVFELPDSRPEIPDADALEIAELIEKRRTIPAQHLAAKLRGATRPGASRIHLDTGEMLMLSRFLEQPSATPDSEAVTHLLARLRLALP